MPQVGIRPLTDDERAVLGTKLRDKTLSVRIWERYRIVGELADGRFLREVADRVVGSQAASAGRADLSEDEDLEAVERSAL